MKDRKVLEAEFHDAREADRLALTEEEFKNKYSNKKFYVIAKSVRDYQNEILMSKAHGSKVLDYCCGPGETSLKLAKMGYQHVSGIDISAEEIGTAKKRLIDCGFEETSDFQVMDAEKMIFPDNSFDVIICNGVLHHLDIDEALPELSRVLKPDGTIVAMEALGYNPLIRLYRKLTPHLRTAWETDHILTLSELQKSKKYFNEVNVKYFYLATLASIPFANTLLFKPIMKITGIIDFILMKIPGIQLMAWQMVFVLKRPKEQKLD
jgi:ubiquinone/menaquinone biosynthesis C-methylase UbiE